MAGKAVDAGKAFLAGVLAKISDPEKRAQVEAIFNDPTSEDALTVVGSGALAQSDINKKYDEIKTKEDALADDYEKLNTWFAGKRVDLEEYDKLKKGGTPPVVKKDDPPTLDTSKFVSQDDFLKTMNEQQRMAADYLGLQNVLTLEHYKNFGEVLDTRELLADKQLGKTRPDGGIYGLIDAYHTKFSDKLSARDKAAEELRINKLADEKVAERMKGIVQPFPLKASPSALDLLEPGAQFKPEDFTAAAAADEYNRLQQNRQGA